MNRPMDDGTGGKQCSFRCNSSNTRLLLSIDIEENGKGSYERYVHNVLWNIYSKEANQLGQTQFTL
jgi:hypothetical protein